MSVAFPQHLLGVTAPAARTALETLAAHGVLAETEVPRPGATGRPRRGWVAAELLVLLTR